MKLECGTCNTFRKPEPHDLFVYCTLRTKYIGFGIYIEQDDFPIKGDQITIRTNSKWSVTLKLNSLAIWCSIYRSFQFDSQSQNQETEESDSIG